MSRYTKTILCLANSWKPGGRCIAGKEINGHQFGGWIRPVGPGAGGAVSFEDRHYQDNSDPALLDIIDIAMSGAAPHPFQPENHQIDTQWYWVRRRQLPLASLPQALDPIQPNLWSTTSSSGSGINDRVLEANAPNFGYSLRLIRVNDLEIRVSVENPGFSDKRTVRGFFSYSHNHYALSVTDPATRDNYIKLQDGIYTIGNAILCISLGEPYGGYCYKLIAGVFII